jgi:hypothetical protein
MSFFYELWSGFGRRKFFNSGSSSQHAGRGMSMVPSISKCRHCERCPEEALYVLFCQRLYRKAQAVSLTHSCGSSTLFEQEHGSFHNIKICDYCLQRYFIFYPFCMRHIPSGHLYQLSLLFRYISSLLAPHQRCHPRARATRKPEIHQNYKQNIIILLPTSMSPAGHSLQSQMQQLRRSRHRSNEWHIHLRSVRCNCSTLVG